VPRLLLSHLLLLFVLLGTVCACASGKATLPEEKTVTELYTEATALMSQKDYKEAAHRFQEVERQHPYSLWATRAQLMAAYAQYQDMDYDAAISALDQYIQLHPSSDNIAYAYYLRGLCSYERIADVRRDQGHTHHALNELQTIIRRFPETSYAKDAVLKIALINDHLAGAEMEIGRNYLAQKLYTAAIGRFRTVIEKYQTTSHVPEALHRLVEGYIILGIKDEAQATAVVLGHNFPGSPWYQDSYNLLIKNNIEPKPNNKSEHKSWVNGVWRDLF